MDLDKVDYILKYYSNLMTNQESAAWRHWSSEYKISHSSLSVEQKQTRVKRMLELNWMSNDPAVLNLLENGIEKFKIKTANRISNDNPHVLELNYCPKCNKLARTPFAKQCRFCFHDWH